MTQTTRRVTCRGNPAFASILVQMLEEEGVTVEWERPGEQRGGIGERGQDVVVIMLAAGGYDAIKAAVDRFRNYMHDRAEATIEDDEQDNDLAD